MKKLFTLLIFIFAFSAVTSYSQNMRVNGYSLYTLDDNVESSSGSNYFNATIKGNLLWGLGAEYNPVDELGIELAYFRQDTDVDANYFTLTQNKKTFKLGANYIMLGGTRYLRSKNSLLEPYAGGMIGLAILENKEPESGAESSATKFAWKLKAGLNIMLSPQLGLKLQMQLLSAVQGVGGGLFIGTGGAGYGLGTYSSMLQFGIGGGLTFRFGKK